MVSIQDYWEQFAEEYVEEGRFRDPNDDERLKDLKEEMQARTEEEHSFLSKLPGMYKEFGHDAPTPEAFWTKYINDRQPIYHKYGVGFQFDDVEDFGPNKFKEYHWQEYLLSATLDESIFGCHRDAAILHHLRDVFERDYRISPRRFEEIDSKISKQCYSI